MKGKLSYNTQNDRYGLLVMDLWKIEGFHCGDTLEVWDSKKEQWIPTRMEMHWQAPSFPSERNNGWYLVDTDYIGAVLEGLTVRVRGGD